MTEMIVPGTYISVREEGLISAGRIATGIVAVVGTAARGPVGVPVTLSGFREARDTFGAADPFTQPEDASTPLTLMRSLEYVFNNGASTVIAVRVAESGGVEATFDLRDDRGEKVAGLKACTPGTWANHMSIRVEPAENDCLVSGERVGAPFAELLYSPLVVSEANRLSITRGGTKRVENLRIVYVNSPDVPIPNTDGKYRVPVNEGLGPISMIRITQGDGTLVRSYGGGAILNGIDALTPATNQLRIAEGEITFDQQPSAGQKVFAIYAVDHDDPEPGEVLVSVWNGSLAFAADEAPDDAKGDTLTASYLVDPRSCVRVSLSAGPSTERYVVPDGRLLAQLMARSRLASCAAKEGNGASRPVRVDAFFGTGSNTSGNDGASADADVYESGLAAIADLTVNIVLLAGQDAAALGEKLLGHLTSTAENDHERIGVIGAAGSSVADFLDHAVKSDRVVLVAPGLTTADGITLPCAYTAAAVAGLISSLSIQTSLTNKALRIQRPALRINRGQQEQLTIRNVLTVSDKEGFRIVKGVTASDAGSAFAAIPTRRIIDFAKYGVRSAANSYIGRLNNDRVRGALKATLDAFLTRMVEDEALTGYELSVTATRAQEIAGEVNVTMTLQPTFSIEFVQVVMVLQ